MSSFSEAGPWWVFEIMLGVKVKSVFYGMHLLNSGLYREYPEQTERAQRILTIQPIITYGIDDNSNAEIYS